MAESCRNMTNGHIFDGCMTSGCLTSCLTNIRMTNGYLTDKAYQPEPAPCIPCAAPPRVPALCHARWRWRVVGFR